MSYIDMFVCAVPTQNREAYVEHVTTTTALLKGHGALHRTTLNPLYPKSKDVGLYGIFL